MDEIKYYQNELTNTEARLQAVDIALISDDTQAVSKIAESCSRTERNFILNKDQSTVEIEKLKMYSSLYKNFIDAAKTFVKTKK